MEPFTSTFCPVIHMTREEGHHRGDEIRVGHFPCAAVVLFA